MTDHPIIFTGSMVRAILAGRKMQTRRALKAKRGKTISDFTVDAGTALGGIARRMELPVESLAVPCAPGDRLWLREGFTPLPESAPPATPAPTRWIVAYAAGGQNEFLAPPSYNPMLYNYERWSPSIHMPRWASRLTLIIENVRVQRLQDISEEDSRAEGIERMRSGRGYYDPTLSHDESRGAVHLGGYFKTAKDAYATLWDSLNAKRGYGWDSNPWVAAITFRPIPANIDSPEVLI